MVFWVIDAKNLVQFVKHKVPWESLEILSKAWEAKKEKEKKNQLYYRQGCFSTFSTFPISVDLQLSIRKTHVCVCLHWQLISTSVCSESSTVWEWWWGRWYTKRRLCPLGSHGLRIKTVVWIIQNTPGGCG